MMVVLALLLPAPALAQEPAPARRPAASIWVNYALENAEPGMDHLAGLSLEGDATVRGTPLSIVGHVSRRGNETSTVTYAALGPRVTKTFGALRLYGHYLYGNASIGVDDSMLVDGMMMTPGGGLSPVPEPNNHRRGRRDHDSVPFRRRGADRGRPRREVPVLDRRSGLEVLTR